MKVERQSRIEELFHSALRLPADEREDFLRKSCVEDATLREEVESLLVYEGLTGNFMAATPSPRGAESTVNRSQRNLHSATVSGGRHLDDLALTGLSTAGEAFSGAYDCLRR